MPAAPTGKDAGAAEKYFGEGVERKTREELFYSCNTGHFFL